MLKTCSDEELLAAHLEGNQTAFTELVRRYADSLLGYLMKMSRNKQQAEDMFQDTFRKVHQYADSFKASGKFKSWLYSIASNVAIDHMRKLSRQPQMVSCDQSYDCGDSGCPVTPLAIMADEAAQPVQTMVLEEQKAQVRKALLKLPEGQRQTVVLAYYQGMKYAQVAEILDCSIGTVKTQMFRALKRLAELLPDVKGGGDE